MGTRHLIAVQLDGDYKVAQYGKWDGYPSGQGVGVLKFLHSMDKEKFKTALRKCRFATKEDFDRINEEAGIERGAKFISMEQAEKIKEKYPCLSRDTGSGVLAIIQNSDGVILKNSIGFAGDSLFCEYAYVIDLDKETFEVYEGFNKEPVENQRFSGAKTVEGEYSPIKLVHTFELADLPTEAQFLELLEPQEA